MVLYGVYNFKNCHRQNGFLPEIRSGMGERGNSEPQEI